MTRKRKLTRAQAWRAIAQKLLNEGKVLSGLCNEIKQLLYSGRITYEVFLSMHRPLIDHVLDVQHTPEYGQGFAYPAGAYHEERAMAALWMALEVDA